MGIMKENDQNGEVLTVSVSEKKGMRKKNVECVELKEDFGIMGDAHAGAGHRQISLLALESIRKMQEKGLDVVPGDFAENITTQYFDLLSLAIGDKIKIGKDVLLEISQIGKICHTRCSIYYQAGDCVMPKEGIFAKVLNSGEIKVNDRVEVL